MNTFGEALKTLRVNNRLSINEMAGKIGISKGLLSRYENDKVIPSLKTAVRLAQFYNVSLDSFSEYFTNNSATSGK